MSINDEEYRPLIWDGQGTNYAISETGKVLNVYTQKHLTPYQRTDNRLAVCITINGVCRVVNVHKLVYIAFYGELPEGMTINHINEKCWDNDYRNLEPMTRSENIKSYLNNRDGKISKKYSDSVIECICEELSNGTYYRDVAAAFDMPIDYVYDIVSLHKRTFISKKYAPFPDSAKYRKPGRKIPHEFIRSMIQQGYSNKEILQMLGMKRTSANDTMFSRERRLLGIKEPKYFPKGTLQEITNMILAGLSNSEIYKEMGLEKSERNIWMLARLRQKIGIMDFNPNLVPLETQTLIMDDIKSGMSNFDILEKYSLDRTYYTINMMARLRKKLNVNT